MSEPPSTLGTRIRAARRALGMTQEQLAAAVGVTRSAVAQWETDRAGQVGTNIPRVASALGLSVEHLLTGEVAPGSGALRGEELALLRAYRACDETDRALLIRTAVRLARNPGL